MVLAGLGRWALVPVHVVGIACAVASIARRRHRRLSWVLCLASVLLGVVGALLVAA